VSETIPSVQDVTEAVDALAAGLRSRSPAIEQARRLPADIVAALREAGVFRLWVPRELGGIEAGPTAVINLLETLAAADGSTGWCSATGLASNCAGAFLSEAGARELYPTGRELAGGALMPGGRAVPQPDGSFLVTGRWSFGTGTQHCDWVIGGAVVVSDTAGPPSLRAVVFPVEQVQFVDTWHSVGLSGTGSLDYQVENVAVPAEHTIDLANVAPWPAGSMWRIPMLSLIFPVISAVPLGIARAALMELSALAVAKTPFRSTKLLAERETAQAAVGRAKALIDAGHLYLCASMESIWASAAAGMAPSVGQRAQARLAAVHATQSAAEAVELCYRTAGSTALYRTSPLQRYLRDVNTVTQHYALNATGYDLVGRVLFGMPADPGL
jgi:alkylation response protein AidB-like acyl-CoA dehydrogenase